jgi:hypothetical protein
LLAEQRLFFSQAQQSLFCVRPVRPAGPTYRLAQQRKTMMRNHVLDAESPQKAGYYPNDPHGGGAPSSSSSSSSYGAYQNPPQQAFEQDPWFEQQNSPKHSGQQNMPAYGGFTGPANHPPPQSYATGPMGYGGMNMTMGGGGGGGMPPMGPLDEYDFDNEPPLLEELGIRFDHIWTKTQAVVNPTQRLRDDILEDADLAGPLFFCLILGSCLLLAGKVHFGYIYGFSVFGCLGLHMIVNLLHAKVPSFVYPARRVSVSLTRVCVRVFCVCRVRRAWSLP